MGQRLLNNGVENLIKETRQECAGKPQAQAVEERWASSSTTFGG